MGLWCHWKRVLLSQWRKAAGDRDISSSSTVKVEKEANISNYPQHWGQCLSTQFPAGDWPWRVALAFWLSLYNIVTLCTGAQLRWYHFFEGWQSLFLLEQMFRFQTVKLQVKQLTILHLCCWESSGREERPGILLLYALKISSKKHKLETSSFKEVSETASLVFLSRQPRYWMLGTHAGELCSCSREKCKLHNCSLRADVTS